MEAGKNGTHLAPHPATTPAEVWGGAGLGPQGEGFHSTPNLQLRLGKADRGKGAA